MRPLPSHVVAVVAACFLAPAARGAETVLDADFDDKTVGLPIGTGGAAVGEPMLVSSTISAVIQDLPLPTPNLKINDSDLSEAGFVRFGFLHDWIIDHGVLTISCTVHFQAFEDYLFRVRERRANSHRFLDLSFGSSANIWYTDHDTPTPTAIGNYETNRDYTLVMEFDLDADTYSVEFDGVTLLAGESYGSPYGIGAVWFGQQADEDDDGEFNVDDLLVTATQVPTAVTPATWAGTKAAWR